MSAYPVILVTVPFEQISPKEGLFAKAWSGCSQQHIPSCKGAFHDVASTTVYRGHAGPELFACNTSLLHPRSLGICPLLNKSPELLGPEQIRAHQIYLTNEKKLGVVSISVANSALRFLYRVTLKKNWCMADMIPAPPKMPKKLPIILSPEEVVRFLDCLAMRKHRAVTTCYAAGLRISEAVALHSQRSTASAWSYVSSKAKDRKIVT